MHKIARFITSSILTATGSNLDDAEELLSEILEFPSEEIDGKKVLDDCVQTDDLKESRTRVSCGNIISQTENIPFIFYEANKINYIINLLRDEEMITCHHPGE